ncbi:hypothetical protein B0H15DRAFT_783568 [Mycena belliarum]|uniref:DUF6589 domain-containing protein n=1 Tax=Mycena belliarum TaxID=1033014 RepID=A0AAD6U1C4_9AGAR|nr:hypothetical protein B0H15DRAFT_783568 [Mycena belliae]
MRLQREAYFDELLDGMSTAGYTLAELLDYVFNPATKLKSDWRWRGFFSHRPVVERIFGYWTSARYPERSRTTVHEWAAQLVAATAAAEAQSITSSGILKKSKKVVDEQFFLNYNLAGLTATLRKLAPTSFGVFDAFSATARRGRVVSAAGSRKKEILRGSAALTLLRGASQYNNYAQAVHSAYLAATGASRQHFAVFGALGSSIGYTSIISSGNTGTTPHHENKKKKKARAPGLLATLSNACMQTTRSIASSGLFAVVYDNINMMVRVAEQVLGRKSAQENGTCATLIPLHGTNPEDLLTATLDESVLNAAHLRIDNLLLTDEEAAFHTENMVHTILRVIVRHGGDGFKKWQGDLDAMQPASSEVIDVHKTPIHPLPSMEIDENSITGNIEVVEAINASLGLDAADPEYIKYIKIIAGDQLTIARQRSILAVRLGHESGPHSWRNIVLMPGLFHAKIADCHGLLETHFGKPNAGTRSPGSLGFHNTVLDRLPITLTSLPPFRTCRDLIMVSLYARILHCLLLVSGKDSLEAYASSVNSWTTIVDHANTIYKSYTDTDLVQELREQRVPDERKRDADAKAAGKGKKKADTPLPHVKKGDMVFENAILFLRDALLTREFTDAVKAGDSGRVVLMLRFWVFSYRGSGRSKYAHEMLHLLHNLTCVWTRELRRVIIHNWLLNPTGKVNSFVEIDLVQEHLNFWIKKIYKADGDGHSWDWLALISPCVDILRSLATRIHTDLGARQGSKHTIPNLDKDIATLMASLDEHGVYSLQEGRVLDDDEKPVADILSTGLAALTHGGSITPLAEFNQQFDILRDRRRLTPVADLMALLDSASDTLDSMSDTLASAVSTHGALAMAQRHRNHHNDTHNTTLPVFPERATTVS